MSHPRVQAPQDLVGGASLVVMSLFSVWAGRDLASGHLGYPGPGMFPRVLAVAVGLVGAALLLLGFLRRGEPVGRWPLRGPMFICLALVCFALTIRAPGLCIAGPAAVLVSGAASPETRYGELAVFALALTAVCVALFRYLLHLPIPILILPGIVTL
jgi:Tripartite tricarboxylate transporter TctB family